MVESLLRLAGLNRRALYVCTVSRRQKTQRVRMPYLPVTHALDLLVTALASGT